MTTNGFAIVDREGRILPVETDDQRMPLVLAVFTHEGVAVSFKTRKDSRVVPVRIEVLQ